MELFKFYLSSLQGVTPANISSVTLSLYVNTSAYGTVAAYHSPDGWTETGITWNNKPTTSILPMGTSPNLTSNGQYYTINLLEGGRDWIAGDLSDGYLSVAIKMPSSGVTEGTYYINNRHNANSPYLRVEVVPIPAAFWLLCSGLIGLIGIRRFRK